AKRADRDRIEVGKPLPLPVHRRPAARAEVKCQQVAAVRFARIARRHALDRDTLLGKARLHAEHAAGAALALQAVAYRNATGLTLAGETKFAAKALRAPCRGLDRHRSTSSRS